VVDPQELFTEYGYQTGVSPALRDHFRIFVNELPQLLVGQTSINRPSILDVGSNDGSLLDEALQIGWETFGVEPASNLLRLNNEIHKIFNDFFHANTAEEILGVVGRKFNIITATNVFAHTRPLEEFVKGVKILLAEDGYFIFEVQYGLLFLKDCLFDMMYHEHTSYHHLRPLVHVLPKYGLQVVDAKMISTHGGSLRVYCTHNSSARISKRAQSILDSEACDIPSLIDRFCGKVGNQLTLLESVLSSLDKEKYELFGYTAPAKATTLISAMPNSSSSRIKAIIDDSHFKQLKYIPGTAIQVLALRDFLAYYMNPRTGKTPVFIIFSWNMFERLAQKLISIPEIRESKPLFVKPLPDCAIVNPIDFLEKQ
jgi:hypothetical protein